VFLALVPLPPLAAAMALSSLRKIPAGQATSRPLVRVRYAAQLAIGAGMLLTGLGWQDRLRLEQPLSLPLTIDLPPLLVALVLVAVGLVVALPAIWYLLPPGTLRAAAGLPAAVAAMALLNLGFFGVDAFVPLALVDLRGQTILFASIALTGGTVSWTIGSWVQARYAATGGRRRLIQTGMVILAFGCALFVPVLWPMVPVALGPLAWTIAGLGMGLGYATLSLVVLETAPKGQEGAAAASLQIASVLGSGLGTGIGGALISSLGAGQNLMAPALTIQFIGMVGILVVGVVVANRLPNRPPADTASVTANSMAEPQAA
jgi:predicted MFS family arabinose efflux permease